MDKVELSLAAAAPLFGWVASSAKSMRWELKAGDLNWLGKGDRWQAALDEAFARTGIPRNQFEVTQWGYNSYGKSVPVEYRHSSGAEVNMDFGHATHGPDVPHIGYQSPGKRGAGGSVRGHILVDFVPTGRIRVKQ